MDTQARRDRLKRIGTMLYGPRYGGQLHKALRIPQSTLAMIMTDERPVTDEIERKLIDVMTLEAVRHMQAYKDLVTATAELKKDLVKEGTLAVSTSGGSIPEVGGVAPEPENDPDREDDPSPRM